MTSRSSVESAPVTILAMIALIFPAELEPTKVSIRTSPASSACSPHACARRITGTNPARDTGFGLPKRAWARDELCDNRIYEVPLGSDSGSLATPIIPAQGSTSPVTTRSTRQILRWIQAEQRITLSSIYVGYNMVPLRATQPRQ